MTLKVTIATLPHEIHLAILDETQTWSDYINLRHALNHKSDLPESIKFRFAIINGMSSHEHLAAYDNLIDNQFFKLLCDTLQLPDITEPKYSVHTDSFVRIRSFAFLLEKLVLKLCPSVFFHCPEL